MTNTRKKITDKEKTCYLALVGLLCLAALLIRKCSRNSEEKVLEDPVPVTSSQTYTPPTATTFDTASSTVSYHKVSKSEPYEAGYSDGYEDGYEAGLYGDYFEYGFSYEGEKEFESGEISNYRHGYDAGYQDGYDDGYSDYVAEKERGDEEEEDEE